MMSLFSTLPRLARDSVAVRVFIRAPEAAPVRIVRRPVPALARKLEVVRRTGKAEHDAVETS
jgi:hypothetical protein